MILSLYMILSLHLIPLPYRNLFSNTMVQYSSCGSYPLRSSIFTGSWWVLYQGRTLVDDFRIRCTCLDTLYISQMGFVSWRLSFSPASVLDSTCPIDVLLMSGLFMSKFHSSCLLCTEGETSYSIFSTSTGSER